MFQSNVEGVQITELRVCTEDVHIGCSLSVHACYKLAATIYFDVSGCLQCRSFSVLSCCQSGFSAKMDLCVKRFLFLQNLLIGFYKS